MEEIKHNLDPGCPWYSVKNIHLPNVKWCERQLCSWIEEPANTWSNLIYILMGTVMILLTRDLKSRALRFYGPAALMVGVTSFIYHASNAFALQALDFLGMYAFCYLVLLINMQRLGKHSIEKSFRLYWTLVLGSTFLTVVANFTPFPIQGLIFILIILICGSEYLAWKKSEKNYTVKWFLVCITCFLIAGTFSYLDLTRVMCDPDNHWLQGHALWHFFNGIGLLAVFTHHKQFDDQLKG